MNSKVESALKWAKDELYKQRGWDFEVCSTNIKLDNLEALVNEVGRLNEALKGAHLIVAESGHKTAALEKAIRAVHPCYRCVFRRLSGKCSLFLADGRALCVFESGKSDVTQDLYRFDESYYAE